MSPIRPMPRAGLMSIEAYVPGKSEVVGLRQTHKLSSNENPLGASSAALSAFLRAGRELSLYPNGSADPLRKAIADCYGLNQEQVVCGAGSDDLIRLLALAYLDPRDEAIITAHGFQIFKIAIHSAGGSPVVAEENNFTASIENILACVSNRTKMIFLANPNNPTGTCLPISEIERLIRAIPSHILLVLDAAYSEYVSEENYSDGLSLVSLHHNVVVTRTFSKVFGLASLRLGWAYAPLHVCDVLHRIRGPFNVNGPGMAAAIEALKDQEHLDKSITHNEKSKIWLSEELTNLGLCVTPSNTNFIMVHFPISETKGARAAEASLLSNGIIVRGLTPYNLPNALRISIGDHLANRALHECLRRFMTGH